MLLYYEGRKQFDIKISSDKLIIILQIVHFVIPKRGSYG